jgi:hypothetical protein
MAKPYDAVLKHLVEAYPAAWLKSLGFPTIAFLLMGLRYPPGMAAELLRGVREMEESSTYQWVMEKGGKKALRETLIDLGTLRFGRPGATTAAVLNSVDDMERLTRMRHRLLDAADWDDLLGTP